MYSRARARARRMRRKLRRGRLIPAYATALSTRTRQRWPVTRAITRAHHYRVRF